MGGFAWVTLATNDSYSLGALVLAHSLRRAGTKHDLAVLITPGVTQAMRDKLGAVFSLVQEVNVLDSKEEANLALLARPELGITFTKLHCWRLTQYEKCIFVDADALVIRNCDELFEREELSAAPDVGWPDCFNSGVFVFRPSQQTFASITAFAADKGSFDGGDQGLLNSYFSDWAHKDIAKHLPFIYNMCSTATYSYLPAYKQYGENARIIHFIGATKPWLQYFDTETGVVHPPSGCNHLQPLLQLWWNIFCENVHPQLSSFMAWSTLAPISQRFTPSLPGNSTSSYPIYDDSSYEHSYGSNISRSEDERYDEHYDDNYCSKEPADFSEFNDPWEEYVPKHTPMESAIFYQQEYIQEQYYDDKRTDYNRLRYQYQPVNPENDNHIAQKSYGGDEKQDRDENQNPFKSGDFYHDRTHRSEETASKADSRQSHSNLIVTGNRENLESSRLQNNFEAFNIEVHKNETEYFQNPSVERMNERLHGESVRDDGQNETDKSPSQDHRQNKRPEEHYIPQSHSHEPCTVPPHNVAQHNEQSVDSQKHLDKDDAGLAGALAQMTLGEPRSSQQSALEEHLRRQGWEQGQIDYMGRDSFDNIWKKICTTLDEPPQREPSPPKEVQSLESRPSVVPEPKPVPEASPPAATKTEDNVVSPISSEDQARALQTLGIVPSTPESIQTIQTPTAQEEVKLQSIELEAKSPEKAEEKIPASLPKSEVPAEILDDVTLAPIPDTDAKVEKFISTFPVDTAPQNLPEEVVEEPLAPVKLATILSPPIPTVHPVVESAEIAKELSELLLDSSAVPIQVAESVLESEPKESVSEEQGPVGEEAVSSLVAPLLRSATAVSETVAEPRGEDSVASDAPSAQKASNGTAAVLQSSQGVEATPEPKETPVSVSAPEPKVEKPAPEPEVEKVAEIAAEEPKSAEVVDEVDASSNSSKSASLTPPESPSTQGPVRPARTRDPKIPTTPTVTEATPPNSPPIGAGQSLDDAPKTVKKVVKKVAKKAPSEEESSEVVEGEAPGKKVVKKIVKKIVKKPKEGAEDDGAEASGTAAEKPKKVVKIVKKIVKPSDSLEVDTSVPETPPVGVPVPPKRKTKTTTTTTTKVTTTTKNLPAESDKPAESEP